MQCLPSVGCLRTTAISSCHTRPYAALSSCRLPPGADPGSIDYAVSPKRAEPFYAAIRAYLPSLPDGALQPAYSGVRPKVRRIGRADEQGAARRGFGQAGGWMMGGTVHHRPLPPQGQPPYCLWSRLLVWVSRRATLSWLGPGSTATRGWSPCTESSLPG